MQNIQAAATSSAATRPRAIARPRLVATLITYVLLVAGSIVMLIPLIWMVSTALKPQNEVFTFPPQLIPSRFVWSNFLDGWTILPFNTYLKNTLIIVTNNVVGNLVSCSLAAFAFSRMRSRFRGVCFALMLSTMMIPQQVTLIPTFILFKYLGWVNTLKALTVPAWFGWPFFIFLLRQFFMTLPRDLDDAARMDGCSTFRIFWSIILPLAKPALATVAIFSFMANWNDFLAPLIYLNSPDKFTLALGLLLFQGQYYTNFPQMMAVSLLVLLPLLVVFFVAQNLFIRGIALTGMKG